MLKTHWETASRGFFGRDRKPLDRNSLDSTEHVSWKDLHYLCFTHLAIFFKELNVTVLPTQAYQKPSVLQPLATAQTPSPAVCETWVGPHISGPSGNHRSHPRDHTARGYSCSIRSWIFVISKYLTAICRELVRDLSSQQMAIYSTFAGHLSCVR